MNSFNESVAVITGAGSGIGRACALAFAEEGTKVVVADIYSCQCRLPGLNLDAAPGKSWNANWFRNAYSHLESTSNEAHGHIGRNRRRGDLVVFRCGIVRNRPLINGGRRLHCPVTSFQVGAAPAKWNQARSICGPK